MEKKGRPRIDNESEARRLSVRLPEKTIEDIERLGEGKNFSEKLRWLIDIGVNHSKKNQDN